ncbi:hypothetical protein [Photobacterium kishitanii]|uniref:hypothetical protein n=1 Tax=Photobacterium kishitanii TaxID=318456 RepID=UPI00043162D2|nr:hypothetical protein [Photobacterium kishitanii]CEO41668.1 hypothetical protein PPBDW_II0999 [Photobacterium kishitanii]
MTTLAALYSKAIFSLNKVCDNAITKAKPNLARRTTRLFMTCNDDASSGSPSSL